MMEAGQSAPHRRFPRRFFRYPLGVLAHAEYQITEGLEVGEGGMLFGSPHKLKMGDHVVLNFFVPKKGFITVTAVVLYIKPLEDGSPSFGVQFNNLAFENKRMIRDYIADKTSEEVA